MKEMSYLFICEYAKSAVYSRAKFDNDQVMYFIEV